MKTKITFQYTEKQDFQEPLDIRMEVPERGIDEMCEYFQRFLSACGYIFDENEKINIVRTEMKKPSYPNLLEDILTFNEGSTPPSGVDGSFYMGVRGGMAEDLINLD